jgi:hypothetical protein
MNQHSIDDITVRMRIADRRRAAEQHRLARIARRARRRGTVSEPQATAALRARTGDLGVDLAALGFDAVEHEMARFIRRARTSGVDGPLLAVLSDAQAPVVVRQRAFARIAATLDGDAPAQERRAA